MDLKRISIQKIAALIHATRAIAPFSLLVRKKQKLTGGGEGESEGEPRGGAVGEGGGCQLLLRFSFLTLSPRRLPLWQYTMQIRLSELVRKNGFLNLLFLTIFGFAKSHTGQRGTPPGERGREKENRSKNRHFPPSFPSTVFLSGLSFPSPLSLTHCRFLLLLRHAG